MISDDARASHRIKFTLPAGTTWGRFRVDGSGAPARIDYVQLTAAAGSAP